MSRRSGDLVNVAHIRMEREQCPIDNPARFSTDYKQVGEFTTEATVEMLNAELADRRIGPERIITVLHVPGQAIANSTTPKFRVLYRAE